MHTFRNRLHALQRSRADLRKLALVLQRGSSESSKFALVLQRGSSESSKFALVLQRGSSESSKFALVLQPVHSTTSSRRSDPWLPSPPPPPGLSALAPAGSMPPHTTPLPTPRPRPLRPGTRRQHASAHHASPPAGATPVLRVLTSSTPHQCRSPPPVCLHMTAQRHALVFRRTRPTDVNLQEVSRFSHSEPPLYHAFSLAPIPTSLPAAHSQPSSSATAWQAQPQPIARSNASSSAPRPQPEP